MYYLIHCYNVISNSNNSINIISDVSFGVIGNIAVDFTLHTDYDFDVLKLFSSY